MIHLSKRLKLIADNIPYNSRLADIGSDHAYLPIYLVQSGIIKYAIASEVIKKPYITSCKHVHKFNMDNIIDVRLAYGLDSIDPKDNIDVINISGMGGKLICNILTKGKDHLYNNELLILEANTDSDLVRKWLFQNNFKIINEFILEENNHIYEIILSKHVDNKLDYSIYDIMFGPILLVKNNLIFQKKWNLELKKQIFILNNLYKSQCMNLDKIKLIKYKIKLIKEILNI